MAYNRKKWDIHYEYLVYFHQRLIITGIKVLPQTIYEYRLMM